MLVKNLQWNRKTQCGHSCRRMLPLFKLFGAYFLFIWYGKAVPTPLFRALHTCLQQERERSDMERNYMNSDKAQWKDPKLNNFSVEWVEAQIYKASTLTLYNIYRNRRIRLSLRARVRSRNCSVKNTNTTKNRQKWHSIDTCLKHIQNHNFSRSRAQK